MSKTQNPTTAPTSSTAVAVSSTTDQIQRVQQELANLTRINEKVYNTADKTVLGTNIITETSVEKLLEIDASVKLMQLGYDNSCQEKIEKGYIKHAKPFALAGVSADGIIADIDLRLQILSTEERRKFLSDIAKGYEELMDKNDKQRLLDAKLNAFLGNGSK